MTTADEVRVTRATLQAMAGRRAILVTSKFHTRRVKLTWGALAGGGLELVVQYTADDPYDGGQWWSNSRDTRAVIHEVGGILNALSGFPLSAARD